MSVRRLDDSYAMRERRAWMSEMEKWVSMPSMLETQIIRLRLVSSFEEQPLERRGIRLCASM